MLRTIICASVTWFALLDPSRAHAAPDKVAEVRADDDRRFLTLVADLGGRARSCVFPGGGVAMGCDTEEDAVSYAMSAASQGQFCWNALGHAASRPEVFRIAARRYYELVLATSRFNVCTKPDVPGRCKRGFCWIDYSFGLELQPLVDVGFAVALGDRDFGFKTETGAVLQAQVGLKARFFIYSDRLDGHVVVGIANARKVTAADAEETVPGIVYGVGIGFWEGILGLNLLGITDPSDGSTGLGLSFAFDPAALQAARK